MIRFLSCLLIITMHISSLAQSPGDYDGKWEGLQYIGNFDSCVVSLFLTYQGNSLYSGTMNEYIPSAPGDNYAEGTFQCSIIKNKMHIINSNIKKSKLKKYPGSFWCNPSGNTIIERKDNYFVMTSELPLTGNCATGIMILYKYISANPEPGNNDLAKLIRRKIERRAKEEYRQRQNILVDTITVDSPRITVEFYDNGEIDGDSISVFVNGELNTQNRKLTDVPFILELQPDSTREFTDIAMFAENLGSIPPNTALMILKDGNRKYEARLTSTKTSNAVIRIKRRNQ